MIDGTAADDRLWTGLRRLRRAALVTLWLELLAGALWPALGVAGGFTCLALLGLIERLPHLAHLAVLVGSVGLIAWLARRGLRILATPLAADADRRLERDSHLLHRPLAVLTDQPAGVTGASGLWPLHRQRALQQIVRLHLGWPRPVLAARDPRALRLLLLLGLTCAVVIAGPDAGPRLRDALIPTAPPTPAPPALELRAWFTPPAWTRLGPAVLTPGQPAVMPAGSRIGVSLTGGQGAVPVLGLAGTDHSFEALGQGSFQAVIIPEGSGALTVTRGATELARWKLTVQPDVAPVVTWGRQPTASRGRIPSVKLSWHASHAYGIASLEAAARLRDRPDLPELVLGLPLPDGRPNPVSGESQRDLTAHPWAGLAVTLQLRGRDGAGLTGFSPIAPFVLPARVFRHPGAQAIVTIRRGLALAPEDGVKTSLALRDLAGRDSLWQGDESAPRRLREIADGLAGKPTIDGVARTQSALWELALQLEETTPRRTAETLSRAQRDLRQALDKPAPRDKAEIDRRAEALRRAMAKHLDALAEQARREPGRVKPFTPEQRRAAEDTLQKLRDAARGDRTDEERLRRDELDSMLQAMREAARTPEEQARAQGRQRGRQQMSAVQDLTRREAGLIDRAETRLNDTGDSDHGPAQAQDSRMQSALRRVLGELMQQYGDLTGAIPPNLGTADTAMHEATQHLGTAQDDLASAAELRAVQALQQGQQEMARTLARKFGRQRGGQPGAEGTPDSSGDAGDPSAGDGTMPGDNGQALGQGEGDGPGGQDADAGDDPGADPAEGSDGQQADRLGDGRPGRPGGGKRDPFGRATRDGTGPDGSGATKVPEEMEQARARAVQEELRRRAAERTRPRAELDYIDRLLRQQ